MVKLSTGREFEVKPLTIDQRVEIDDEWNIFMSKMTKPEISYAVALKAIRYSLNIGNGHEIDDLSNLEIVELFNEIFMLSHTGDMEKKS